MPRYNPATIEPKWQRYWEEHRTFAAPRMPQGPKLYVLDMFPYPSGDGLHVGHPEGYTATDIVCRYHRMRGRSVIHPMGWDAFGLPAEQHAKKTGTPPRITTERNIATFRRQLKMLGFSYDWDRELATTDVAYFRWTQWIFLVLFDTWFDPAQQKGRPIAELPVPPDVATQGELAVRRYQDEHRLAYQLEAPVNWCPALGTVLANEEVVGGVSERGGHPVVRIPLRQWMLRITSYADRLEKDLELVDWSESIKTLQRNWIGRSTGAEVDFFIGTASGKPSPQEFKVWRSQRAEGGSFPRSPGDEALRIYTTRPDTLYGATYMVMAPEHPLVKRLTTADQQAAVTAYCEQAARKSDLDRTDLAKSKTGVFTGSFAVNPANQRPVPIWVADYVLAGYGTGAIMAVPAHDTRDFEFAQQFGLSVVAVVDPGQDTAEAKRDEVLAGRTPYTGLGVAINSSDYTGLATDEFKQRITADLAARGVAREAVNYKLRDWLFSRQHFWGEPFPILHELDAEGRLTGQIRAIPADELPVDLPDMPNFKAHDTPEPPLEQAPQSWLYVERDGQRYKRETNTMPQWAGSCWYYLRFLDPKNEQSFIDPAIEKAWMPVDLYVGGAEHAVLHLLYSRFWHKVLFDRGHVSMPEPFQKLVNQGMILGEMLHRVYTSVTRRMLSPDVMSSGDVEQAHDDWQTSQNGWRETPFAGSWLIRSSDKQSVYEDTFQLVSAETAPTTELQGEGLWSYGGVDYVARYVPSADVVKSGDVFVLKAHPHIRTDSRAYKMSKSRGNVVNPDKVVQEYGADSLRLYEMFMGPLEASKPWSMEGVNGVRNFLDRVWRMIVNDKAEQVELNAAVQSVEPTPEQNRVLHKTIAGVTQDLDRMAFNTAIAKMMEFSNHFTRCDVRPRTAMEKLVQILSPFAPHLAEELWQLLGHSQTLAYEPWPQFDPAWTKDDTIEVPVQINGKLRSRITVPADASREALEAAARADEQIAKLLAAAVVKKVVIVPGRMVNFVIG